MKKIILFICLLFLSSVNADPPDSRARGIFFAIGVGTRLPVFDFSDKSYYGYGIDLEISYTDNEWLPVFLYAETGFEHYSGSQDYYQSTNLTHYSLNVIPINLGARWYGAPMTDNFFIIPFVQGAAEFSYEQELNQYKIGSGRNDQISDKFDAGASVGVGASMFVMEVLVSYHHFTNRQFISLDMKARIPLFVIF